MQHLGQELASEAALVQSVGADTRLSEFGKGNFREFVLGKRLSSVVADVFRRQFDLYNSDGGKREFGRYWLHRGNGDLEFAYYRLGWQMHWPIKGREEALGILVSEIWSVNLAKLGSRKPKIDLRFRLQIDPHTTKKALLTLLTADQISNFYKLRDRFKKELAVLASEHRVEGYRDCSSYLQVGKVPVSLDPEATLAAAAKKLWEESVRMAPLIDEALVQLGSFGYNLKVLKDDGEAKEEERLPCFQAKL